MTFNKTAYFVADKQYNPETGNYESGIIGQFSGVEIHTVKDDSISGDSGAGRTVVRVRTRRDMVIPQNANLIYRGYEWKPLLDTQFHEDILENNRHWRTMRYISMGKADDEILGLIETPNSESQSQISQSSLLGQIADSQSYTSLISKSQSDTSRNYAYEEDIGK